MKASIALASLALTAISTFAKEPVSTGPVTTATPDHAWEISAGVQWQEMNMQWDTKALPAINARAFTRKESDQVAAPAVTISKKIAQVRNTQLLMSLGWSRAEASWESGEFEAGEGADEIYTSDISDFEVSMNRFVLALEARTDLGGGFSASVLAGPTLTLVNGDFFGTQETFQHVVEGEFGVFRYGTKASASGTEAAFGVMGGASLRYTFPCNRLFVQVQAGYNWSEEVRFGSSQIGAKFDGSTWAAGVSVGYKF